MVWDLHAVIISRDIPEKDARKISQEFINNKNRNFMRLTDSSYRYRNISKQKFSKFRTKKLNDYISLIYGQLK